jgi:hypothetical protein
VLAKYKTVPIEQSTIGMRQYGMLVTVYDFLDSAPFIPFDDSIIAWIYM